MAKATNSRHQQKPGRRRSLLRRRSLVHHCRWRRIQTGDDFDGVGEWSTTCLGVGRGNRLELTDELRFPHSLGLLYSAFTYYTGFRVNSGEYKVMGMSPYGDPNHIDKIEIQTCEKLTVKMTKELGASHIVRGLRAVTDFEYEFQLALMNRKLKREIQTVFLMTGLRWIFTSSSGRAYGIKTARPSGSRARASPP